MEEPVGVHFRLVGAQKFMHARYARSHRRKLSWTLMLVSAFGPPQQPLTTNIDLSDGHANGGGSRHISCRTIAKVRYEKHAIILLTKFDSKTQASLRPTSINDEEVLEGAYRIATKRQIESNGSSTTAA